MCLPGTDIKSGLIEIGKRGWVGMEKRGEKKNSG